MAIADPSVWEDAPATVKAKPEERPLTGAQRLARRFYEDALTKDFGHVTNQAALRNVFSRHRRHGVTYEELEEAMACFWFDFVAGDAPAWKVFIKGIHDYLEDARDEIKRRNKPKAAVRTQRQIDLRDSKWQAKLVAMGLPAEPPPDEPDDPQERVQLHRWLAEARKTAAAGGDWRQTWGPLDGPMPREQAWIARKLA